MERYLIITADDFGFSRERNQGVIEVYKNAAITSASLLLNCTGTNDAAQFFTSNKLCSGLHLNLTEGHAMSKKRHSTLTSPSGEFFGKFELRKLLEGGKIDPDEIKLEIECQIELFWEMTGEYPKYVDGHQHIHVHPAVAPIFLSALQARGIRATRLPLEVSLESKGWINPTVIPFYNQVMDDADKCRSIFETHCIRHTDAFVGLSTMGADMTEARLQSNILEGFQEAENKNQHVESPRAFVTCEVMCHPGYATGKDSGGFDGRSDEFGSSKDREHEVRVLSSEEMLRFYEKENIHLVSHEFLCNI